MKRTLLPIAAAILGAIAMSSGAQAAAPGASQALKVQAGQSAVEEVGFRCRRVCRWHHGHRHCKVRCGMGHRHHHHHHHHHRRHHRH